MKTASEQRCIRFFISSTFSDMHKERDYLVDTLFPNFRKKTAERNVSLVDVDLRWGIKESESKDQKVIDICLDEIERSHPFFIGLLGERYGWAPIESKDTDWAKVISEKNRWVTDYINEGKSITEIEMIYGVLNAVDEVNGCFFVKKCDENKLDPRLKNLRDVVRNQKKIPVYEYEDFTKACECLERDFNDLLDELYPICNGDDEFDFQRKLQDNYIRSLTEYYTSVSAADELLMKSAEGNGHILLKGKSGMGKSTCMAHLATKFMDRDDCDVISYFSGGNIHDTTFEDVIDWITENLSRLYHIEKSDVDIAERLSDMVMKISLSRPLYIFLDGVNQYQTEVKEIKNFSWWPQWPSGVVCVFSSTDSSPVLKELAPICKHTVTVTEMLIDQRLELIDNYLSPYRKQLDEKQTKLLLTDAPLIRNTHLFVTLLDEVRRYGSYENLTGFISDLVFAGDSLHFYNIIFDNQQRIFDNANELADVLSLIALSEQGLPESDIWAISGITRLKLSQILIANERNLSVRNGRIIISHQIFYDALAERFLKDEEFVKAQREKITDYYEGVEDNRTTLATSELCYQYYKLGYYDNLYKLVSEIRAFGTFSNTERIPVYAKYWNKLLLEDPFRYDPRAIVNDCLLPVEGLDYNFTLFMAETKVGIYITQWLDIVKVFLLDMRQPKYAADILQLIIKLIHGLHSDDMADYERVAYNYLAVCEKQAENWDGALRVYHKMLENYDLENYDPIISNLGEALLTIYEATRQPEYLQMANSVLFSVLQARIENSTPKRMKDVAVAYANYASALHHINPEESARMREKALEIYKDEMGHNSIDVAIEYNNMALELVTKDLGRALEYAQEALAIYENIEKDSVQTANARHLVAEILYKSGDYAEAAEEYTIVMGNREYLNDIAVRYDVQAGLMMCHYSLKKFEDAVEIGMNLTRCLSDDDPKLITILENIGKIYISMTNLDKSVEYYERAISLAENLGLHERELDAYLYLSQAYMGANALEKVVETLDMLYNKACGYGLHISRHTAYALFNRGVIIARYNNDIEGGINDIENAIAIREQTDDELKESDLNEYRRMLDQVIAFADYSDDEDSDDEGDMSDADEYDMSDPEIEEFNGYLSDVEDTDFAEYLSDVFGLGYQNFKNGNIEAAKNYFTKCVDMTDTNEDLPLSVISVIYRYYAYTLELIYVRRSFEKGSKEDILECYALALDCAREDRNYSLSRKILHDIAEFYWALGQYHDVECYYWQELAENISHDIMVDDANVYACSNLIAAMKKQESGGDAQLILHIGCLGMTFLRQDKDIFESNAQSQRLLGGAIADALEELDMDIDKFEIEYGRSAHFIADYIYSSDFQEHNLMARCLYYMALGYYQRKNESENAALCIHNCALTAYLDSLNGMAISFLENNIELIRENLSKEQFIASVEILGRSYVRVHNFDKLNELCGIYGHSMDSFRDEMSNTSPAFSALKEGRIADAQNLVEILRSKDTDELEESELYDLICYYLHTDSPYEAERYFRIWEGVIKGNYYYSYFESEYNRLSCVFENLTN